MSLGLHFQENDEDDIVNRKSLSDFKSARMTLGAPGAELEPISDADEGDQDDSNQIEVPSKAESDGEVYYGEEEDKQE